MGLFSSIKKIVKPASKVLGGKGNLLTIGAGLLGSILAGHKAQKYYGKAVGLSKSQLEMARNIYNVTAPSYGLLAEMYHRILQGDVSTPLYTNPRSQIELATRQGLENIRRSLARRGLGSSGLLASMQERLYADRAKALGDLYYNLLRQAQGFTATGVSLGLGQGASAVANLARQYSALGSMYGGLAGGLGEFTGGLLATILSRKGFFGG